jgi:hypothetical protein
VERKKQLDKAEMGWDATCLVDVKERRGAKIRELMLLIPFETDNITEPVSKSVFGSLRLHNTHEGKKGSKGEDSCVHDHLKSHWSLATSRSLLEYLQSKYIH